MKYLFKFLTILYIIFSSHAIAKEISIGVLAKRGAETCLQEWNETAEYLTNKIPQHQFIIKPLDFNEIKPAVNHKSIDFVLTNPAFYVDLEINFGIHRIATLTNRYTGSHSTDFGGVIFRLASRDDLIHIKNLRNKKFMAVDQNSFGGWHSSWRELKRHKIDPQKDFKALFFGGTHDSVVYAVQKGIVDAGAVRTEILEKMHKEGKINMEDFYVFPPEIYSANIPFKITTQLYPEWPLAKLEHVSQDLGKIVSATLLKLPSDSKAAKNANSSGWTVPGNYQSVHNCLKELEIGPYEKIGEIPIKVILEQYWAIILSFFILLIILALLLIRVIKSNKSLRQSESAVQEELYLRKQTEAALVEAKEHAESIFQIVPSAIFTVNSDSIITTINNRAAEILGYKSDELIGKSCTVFAHQPCSECCGIFTNLERHTIRNVTCSIMTKSGDIRTIRKNAQHFLDINGRVTGAVESFEDITQQMQSELKLQESEARFRELFNCMSSGVAVYEAIDNGNDFVFKDINTAGQKIDNLNKNDLIGKSIKEVFPSVVEFGLFDILKAVWQTGNPESQPLSMYKDARIEAARENYVYKIPSGEIVAIYDDMTEKVQAQQELEESKTRFELAVQGSSDGIWDWDLISNDIYYSPRWKEQIGYHEDELDNCLETFQEHIHPNDYDRVFDTLNNYLGKKEEKYEIEFQFRHKDGSYRWILDRGIALWDRKGKPYRISGSHMDITKRKETEKKLTILANQLQNAQHVAKMGSWEYNLKKNGKISWSEGMYIIHGLNSKLKVQDFSFKQYIKRLVYKEDQKKTAHFLQNLTPKTNHKRFEYRIEKPSGEVRWVHTEIDYEVDEKQQPILVIGTVQDITERVLSRLELEKAKNAAEIANRIKSEFLANMSHEIRTPLNAILGFSEILSNKIADPTYKNYLSAIDSSGKTLLTLINDILDLSKIEAGKLKLQLSPTNVYDIFKEIENIFSYKLKNKGLEFDLQVDHSIPNALLIDEIRLRQILLNIVGNAVKFTHSGYIKLNAEKKITNKESSSIDLIISVEDTGIGISKNQQISIFKSFHQQTGQDSAKYGGTGLGLTITKRLVEIMNGKISLKSEKNKGSIFTVHLKNIPISSVDEEKQSSEEIIDWDIEFDSAKILIVDDIHHNRTLIKNYIEDYPFKIHEAKNGAEAVEFCKQKSFDLVFMDIKMPVMDGIEATQKIKTDPKTNTTTIVALTASTIQEEKQRILDIGCNGYIRKPVSKKNLISELAKHLPYKKKPEISAKHIKVKNNKSSNVNDSQIFILNNKNQLQDAIYILNNELIPEWQKTKKTFIMGQIKTFANKIKNMEIIGKVPSLNSWADEVIKDVDQFNIEELPDVFDTFPKLIENLELAVQIHYGKD